MVQLPGHHAHPSPITLIIMAHSPINLDLPTYVRIPPQPLPHSWAKTFTSKRFPFVGPGASLPVAPANPDSLSR